MEWELTRQTRDLASLSHQVLDILPRHGEDIHVLGDGAEADETFGEQFARAQFERLGIHIRHHLDDAAAFADVRAFV